jgi:lipopolysaccharide export LptBFGC system permease protein LptF
VLLAVPIGAGIGTARSNTFGRNLATGAGVGIIFYLASQLIQGSAGGIHLPAAVVAFLPVTLVLAAAAVLIKRMR